MINNFKSHIILLIVAVVSTIVVLGLLNINNPFSRPEATIDLSRPSVIKEIQSLGNLETASYSVEKIVEAGQEGNFVQNLLFGDKLLLVANGKVTAGVNLTQIEDKDVSIRGKKLTVNLPAPIILSSSLDNSKTKVYDRSQGYLSQANKDLESQARLAAEDSITQAACDAGILVDAQRNAIDRIRQLFLFAGFEEVQVNVPAGQCSLN